jgi:hypothetical protein
MLLRLGLVDEFQGNGERECGDLLLCLSLLGGVGERVDKVEEG